MIKTLENKASLFLAITAFLIYANTLNHGYVLDDFSVIKENFVVQKGLDGIETILKTHYRYGYGFTSANLYRPLPLVLFAFQWELAPDNAAFAHWMNVLFYAFSIVLLFYFLLKLFGKQNLGIAFLSSLLFSLHPIHTEVVANIKSADELLAFIFILSSMIYLLKNIDTGSVKYLYISLVFFTLAFFSKENTVTFLAVIPVSLIFFRSYNFKNAIIKTLPYFIPFIIYMISRINVLGSFSGNKTIAKIDNLLMAAPNEAVRIATAIKILGLYLWKLIVPYPLMNDYSMQQITLSNFQDWKVILSFITYSILIFLVFKLRKKHKILSFSILFYLINLFLYSNLLITIGTSFGERLLFIPSLGFSIVIAFGLYKLFSLDFEKIDIRSSKILSSIVLVVFLGYSYQTISRNRAWKDNYTLYTTDVKNCDKSARCHYYHGLGLMKEKALNEKNINIKNALIKESIQAFTKSIEILPTYSNAYGQRGIAYYRLNNLELAVKDYEKSIQLNPMNATTLSNLGSVYFQTQQYEKAKDAYEKAIRANPNFVDAIANYASTLGTMGEYNSAITYFKRAIAIRPNEPNYYQMIGLTYQNMGIQQQANIYFRKAQELRR